MKFLSDLIGGITRNVNLFIFSSIEVERMINTMRKYGVDGK